MEPTVPQLQDRMSSDLASWSDFVNDLEFVLTRITNEYNAFIKGEENDRCVYCHLKEIDPSLALLCRHDFIKETVNVTGLNKRFFKVDICNDIASGTIAEKKIIQVLIYNFQNHSIRYNFI